MSYFIQDEPISTVHKIIMYCDSCKATLLEPKIKHVELEKTITGPLNSKAAYIINIYRYRMILL